MTLNSIHLFWWWFSLVSQGEIETFVTNISIIIQINRHWLFHMSIYWNNLQILQRYNLWLDCVCVCLFITNENNSWLHTVDWILKLKFLDNITALRNQRWTIHRWYFQYKHILVYKYIRIENNGIKPRSIHSHTFISIHTNGMISKIL